MSNFFKKIFVLLLVTTCLLPLSAGAQTQSCYTYTYHLAIGSTDAETGGEVTKIQTYLYNLGLLDHTPTGYFGTLTYNALVSYQNIKGINDVGEVGPITRSALHEECTSGETLQPLYHFADINKDIGCIEVTYDLQFGSHDYVLYGPVNQLQTFLFQNSLMYYAPTGYFGPLTQAAVKKYQGLRNIPQTGVFDFPTRYTLAKETCGGTTTLTPPVVYAQTVVQ